MPPSRRRSPVDPARLVAFEVLKAVRVEDAYTNLVLPSLLRKHGLSGRDAGFATELASGTIRWQGTYDAILTACIDRPLRKVESKVLDALRLGAHQLLAMRVPTHAAISTTVDLVRDRVSAGAAGFANAVLRKVAAQDLAAWVAQVGTDAATAYSHPAWVVDELRAALKADSGDDAELDALLAADNEPPKVTLVARPGRSSRDELPGEPTAFSSYGVVLAGGDPGQVPAVAEGRAGVQDEGSQLVAMAAAAAPVDGSDARWLDLCAGPGGKAALLAALAAERGARLVASERQPHRAQLVRRALRGADGVLGVVAADGTAAPYRRGSRRAPASRSRRARHRRAGSGRVQRRPAGAAAR